MKIRLLALLLLILLLGGCANSNAPIEDNTIANDGQPADPDDTDARIAYYEQLVSELRQEILSVRTELYVTRVEYEERIAELESQKEDTESTPEHAPSVASQFTYVVRDGAAVITAYTGNERTVTVPSSIDGYPVCEIADRAFADQFRLIAVELPDGITAVGWFAFSGCVSLESVRIPASVRSIAYGAFENCPAALVVLCPASSYAAQYAASYGLVTRAG